jgi:SAM-dependent methyltransferase
MNDYSIGSGMRFQWASMTGQLNQERLSHLRSFIAGKKILDAGCGGGAYAAFLTKEGYDVTGVDAQSDFVRLAQDRDQSGTYLQADITSLPFKGKQFDSTYCFDVLEHVDDVTALQELARVTSDRLIITVPTELPDATFRQYGLSFITYQDPTHLRYYTPRKLLELCSLLNARKITIIEEGVVSVDRLMGELLSADCIEATTVTRLYYRPYLAKGLIKRARDKLFDILLSAFLRSSSHKDQLLDEMKRGNVFLKLNLGLAVVIDL